MSRLALCGGLFLEAVAGVLSLPGVSYADPRSAWIVGALMTALPAIYKFATGPLGVFLTPSPELPALERMPLWRQ